VSTLLTSIFFTLFAVIALGMLLGALRWRGVSLGAAGVFFVALAAGHFLGQLGWKIPHELTELGLVLFVYAVGLQAGPRFFGTLRKSGLAFLAVGVGATLLGAVATLIFAKWFDLPAHLAGGLYCGATTCTPALAAALDAIRRVAPDHATATNLADAASVGYGAAYPFSVAAVVLIVQLMPRILKTHPEAAAAQYREAEAARTPALQECAFRITNPNCAGRTVDELQSLKLSRAVLCRIKHAGQVGSVRPETKLELGDTVLAVGTPVELAKLETLLGDVVVEPMQDPTGVVTSEQLLVSRRDVIGKSLRELCLWERFGVVATRVRREGLEFTPHGDLRLEPADVLRVVGPRHSIAAVSAIVGREERRLNETSFIPFAAGIAIGAAVGQIPISLPGGLQMQLGTGGGVFLVALLLGHWGTRGAVRVYVPNAAKHFARELGLVLFLAGAGAGAGQRFVPILQESGVRLLVAGAAITLLTVGAAILLMHVFLRWNLLFGAGGLCACMTNPPGLAAATNLVDSDAAAVGFASVYPVALIAKILFAPLIFLLLRMMQTA
jgi:putative transport protein